MSALAKVFVVLVFVLSLLFFGTAATLYKTRTDWKSQYENYSKESTKQLNTLKERNDQISKANDNLQKDLTVVRASEDQLAKDNKQKVQDLETEKGKVTQAQETSKKSNEVNLALTSSLDQQKTSNTQLQQALDKIKEQLETQTKTVLDANAQRDSMRLDLSKVQEELHSSRKELMELTDRYETLEIQHTALLQGGSSSGEGVAPPIDAIVNAVDNTEKLVVLSAGKDQKVAPGYEFTIYRGDQLIGKVKVTKVYPDLAGARILWTKDDAEVQRGDKASTLIGG
jgi:predicted RND superfamily exporter protein